jgi:hypothetical protein
VNRRALTSLALFVISFGGLVLWRSEGQSAQRGQTPPPLADQGEQATQPLQAQTVHPKVDIVFALDTTGSMGGLIQGAKDKIWDVARKAQEGKPTPELRVGLVAYRDVGDEYVTRVLDLTSDMDKVYATLAGFQANGGGDGPEHVLKGLRDAVDEEHWSSDPNAVKLIYLVGDAPPHFDYHDGITMSAVVADATRAGIRISAIRCGNDPETLRVWTDIAQKTDGEVASIAQSGGVAVVTTPYDADLARLNRALADTEIHWGSAAERRESDHAVAESLAAPAQAQADRAAFIGSAAMRKAAPMKKDLAATPAASAAAVPSAELPETMQAMSPEERASFVAKKQSDRAALLAQVEEANKKRTEYLHSTAPAPAPTAFDSKVYDSLRKAGAKKGVSF